MSCEPGASGEPPGDVIYDTFRDAKPSVTLDNPASDPWDSRVRL